VNRVILLSDGLANRGITDPHELNRIARQYRSRSISITTMGVGLDYNENLMVGLSESGGGNYYFIESSYGLASMLQKEFNTIASVLAQNASIELTLGRGVRVLDIIGCEYGDEGGRYIIQVGDLYAQDRREFTVQLQIPEGSGSVVVARGALRFRRGDVPIRRVEPFAVTVHYTRDAAIIEKNLDRDVQARADIAASTRKVEQALGAVDEGNFKEAEYVMSGADAALSASPVAREQSAAGAAVREQIEKLRSYADTLQQNKDDVRRAKKAVQFDNYRTQKKK
jgi:Ca-activated chloride channel family protein